MIEPTGLHAVVTGDTVGSSDLSPDVRRRLPSIFHAAYDAVQDSAPESLPYDLAITGGDGWQWYIHEPETALARVLQFWTLLFSQGISSRMALAIDTIDFVSAEDLNESDGPAFRQSGRMLSDLDADRQFDCALPAGTSSAQRLAIESIGELIDHLLQQWTEAQAQAIAGMVSTVGTDRTRTQEEVAEAWTPEPVARQTVNRHLKRAYWHRLERTLDRFKELVETLTK